MTALALKATMTVRRLPPLRAARSVAAERRRARAGPRVRGAAGLGRIGADLFGQLQDLAREVEQLLVLLVFLLDRLPLLVGENLSLGVRPVLADHHERGEEDRLERDDHGQQAEGVLLDAEADPAREPDDVEVDERHRAGERRDLVGDPVLDVLGALFGVLQQRRADRRGPLARQRAAEELADGGVGVGCGLRVVHVNESTAPAARAEDALRAGPRRSGYASSGARRGELGGLAARPVGGALGPRLVDVLGK